MLPIIYSIKSWNIYVRISQIKTSIFTSLMPRNRVRAPYKQYEIDTSLSVPRSTLFEICKRHFAEVEDDNPVFVAVGEESDDRDCHIQVRLDKFQVYNWNNISCFVTSSSRYVISYISLFCSASLSGPHVQNNHIIIYLQLNDRRKF